MTTGQNAGPLAGIKVVDFGQYIAGPAAAMVMADQGASVTRVEKPTGPEMKTPANAIFNRGKTIKTLDLKTDSGLLAAKELIASADVLIENFRPGVMERLGLGASEMMTLNPGLIYLSLPGFAATDEEYAGLPAWEGVVAAAMGQFTDMGLNRVLMGIEASYSPIALASAYASVFGPLAVTLALRARQLHGKGAQIEVPLAAALMEGLAYNSFWMENLPERYKSLREREILRRRSDGSPMNLAYKDLLPLLDPFYRTYWCKDGRPFYVVSEAHENHSERALKILGLWDEFVAQGVPQADPYRPMNEWPGGVDCTIKAYPVTEPWASKITARMAEKFREKDAAEWETIFGETGAPAAAHRTTQEWLRSAHPREAGLLVELDTEYGPMVQPGPIGWLQNCPPVIGTSSARGRDGSRGGAAPARRAQVGLSGSTASSSWLEGITILDLTNVIAGPTIANTLARFGARVIKLDPVKPSFDPWNTILNGIYGNRGKESILVDLKSSEGREVLSRLLEMVDVVTINASAKQLPGIGLDYDEMKKINPRIILCHLDAFGGPSTGPRSNYPGYDDLVQASTGIMERFGGSFDTVEEHAHFGTIDVLGGVTAAFAVAMALLRRESTGEGDVARSSLAAAGQWIQSRFMYDYAGRGPFNEPRGREVKGEGPFYRCYQASDGWFFLAAGEDAKSHIAKSPVLRSALTDNDLETERNLERVIRQYPIEFWKQHLSHPRIAVQRLDTMNAVRHRTVGQGIQSSKTISFYRDEKHPSGRVVEFIQPTAIRVRDLPLTPLKRAEKYGSSTVRVLSEIGYSAPEIEKMRSNGSVGTTWCEPYLPE